jgi:hypothetical protein
MSAGIKWGMPAMRDDDDLHAVVAHVRLIAADCFDMPAVERLRFSACQIERKMQAGTNPNKSLLHSVGHRSASRNSEKSLLHND